jgi:HK97 family phage prohead protease
MRKKSAPAMVNISRFHALAAENKASKGICVRLALASEPVTADDERVASFVFSDNSVDSYGDSIDARGWDLRSFQANPIALFGHDPSVPENVIGKARNVRVQGTRLVGEIVFADAAVNPRAETVFQMVKNGFLNAVSVGFEPLEWAISKDKSRPGGIDFTKQKLREISVVAIPANENALVQARAAGLDVDGLKLRAPIALRDVKLTKKGLYSVSSLAMLLAELGWLEESVEWEAEYEGDGSEIPGRLTEALKNLGQILVDMTIEEVNELLGVEGDEMAVADPLELAAATPAQTAVLALAKALTAGKPAQPLLERAIPTAADDEIEAQAMRRRRARALQLQVDLIRA